MIKFSNSIWNTICELHLFLWLKWFYWYYSSKLFSNLVQWYMIKRLRKFDTVPLIHQLVCSCAAPHWMIVKQHSPWESRVILLERLGFPVSIMSVLLGARFVQQHKLLLPLKDVSSGFFAPLDFLFERHLAYQAENEDNTPLSDKTVTTKKLF